MSEENHPRIVIFGATGRLGRLLVAKFHDAGHGVLSVGRVANTLAALPGESAVFDLTGFSSGKDLVRPGDIVINSVHARFTQPILHLCPRGIERLIVIGSTRYLTRFADRAADEVREAARALRACELPWVLLHPTMIYGAAGESNVQRMAQLIARFHIVPLPGGGRALIQPIHVADVAEAVLRASGLPEALGKAIHLAGPQAIPYRDFLCAIAGASGSWVRVLPLPLAPMMAAAAMTRLIPGVATIKDAEVLRLQEDKAVELSQMQQILKLIPRPLHEGLAETFARGGGPQ